jgi:hypothetical protein
MRFLYLISLCIIILLTTSCTTQYPNQSITGLSFPSVSGQTLEKKNIVIPSDFSGTHTLLLIGFKHKSQFDIDRWYIGLNMSNTVVDVYEIPAIQGTIPIIFSTAFDNSMREGIPENLWKGVITVYEDGETIQAFTGNVIPKNARVVLLNNNGKILYFYDKGFSIDALSQLRSILDKEVSNDQ